jgi:hypothetical protein
MAQPLYFVKKCLTDNDHKMGQPLGRTLARVGAQGLGPAKETLCEDKDKLWIKHLGARVPRAS